MSQFLSIPACKAAILTWKTNSIIFSTVKDLLDPTAAFHFSKDDCEWLDTHNNNSNFHAYMGILNNAIILITVPIDANGKEIVLPQYLANTLAPLSEDLTLVETEVVTTTKKTVFSTALDVTNYTKEIDLPIHNEPIITEKASVNDLIKWKDGCLDWFYKECNKPLGENIIFKTFTVPTPDLKKDDGSYVEVKALFGFKFSPVYQMQLAALIFVSIDNQTLHAQFSANTRDYSQPCPPMCKNVNDFILLG